MASTVPWARRCSLLWIPTGKLLPSESGVDLGTQETNQPTWFRDSDVPQRSPRGEDAACGGVPEICQIGQAETLVCRERLGNPHHLQEG